MCRLMCRGGELGGGASGRLMWRGGALGIGASV